jgi:hypothetical protein
VDHARGGWHAGLPGTAGTAAAAVRRAAFTERDAPILEGLKATAGVGAAEAAEQRHEGYELRTAHCSKIAFRLRGG